MISSHYSVYWLAYVIRFQNEWTYVSVSNFCMALSTIEYVLTHWFFFSGSTTPSGGSWGSSMYACMYVDILTSWHLSSPEVAIYNSLYFIVLAGPPPVAPAPVLPPPPPHPIGRYCWGCMFWHPKHTKGLNGRLILTSKLLCDFYCVFFV